MADFPSFLYKKELLRLPVCLPAHQPSSEKESNLQGMNLLPKGANSFLVE